MANKLGITKEEIKILERRGYKFSDISPNGQTIDGVVMIVHDPSKRHDSGFPFIRAFGILEGSRLIDMGWHDHFVCQIPVNTDAYGKNIFHVMPWGTKRFKTASYFLSCSSLMLDDTGEWS